MKKHLSYFKYVLAHKWYVLVATWRIGGSMWHALIHDLSKFLPSEWGPYANHFYAYGSKAFDMAWNYHQKRNKHHWQYWVLYCDDGATEPMPIPKKHVLEMIADWAGAGRAINGRWEITDWYVENRDNIYVHPKTRELIDRLIFLESSLGDFL
jgi:hypothetical protein